MIQIKTKDTKAADRFGILFEPHVSIAAGDAEMYRLIRVNGFAKIGVFDGASYTVKTENTLTPQEFEENWIGD